MCVLHQARGLSPAAIAADRRRSRGRLARLLLEGRRSGAGELLRALLAAGATSANQEGAQSCLEDQRSAARRIETTLTANPTIQPATS
jgi:hypothetical protein